MDWRGVFGRIWDGMVIIRGYWVCVLGIGGKIALVRRWPDGWLCGYKRSHGIGLARASAWRYVAVSSAAVDGLELA